MSEQPAITVTGRKPAPLAKNSGTRLDVPCAYCKAWIGVPCYGGRGNVRVAVHRERWVAARVGAA